MSGKSLSSKWDVAKWELSYFGNDCFWKWFLERWKRENQGALSNDFVIDAEQLESFRRGAKDANYKVKELETKKVGLRMMSLVSLVMVTF